MDSNELIEKLNKARMILETVAPYIERLEARIKELEAETQRLREYYDASCAVRERVVDFDIQRAAVERLRRATDAMEGNPVEFDGITEGG